MFEINEYVIHMTGGICQVKDICQLQIPGADKNRKYYCLMPVSKSGSKVFVPTDNDSAMRKIITADEARELIDEIPSIDEMEIDNDKFREMRYKEVIKSCDLRMLVSVIKNLHNRRYQRIVAGKKTTATDEKYSKIAEENLYSELAFVLGRDRKEMENMISGQLDLAI